MIFLYVCYQLGFCSMPLRSISFDGMGNSSCLPFWKVPYSSLASSVSPAM